MREIRINHLSQPASMSNQSPRTKGSDGFGSVINEAIHKVNKLENEADSSLVDLLQGKASVHETMISLQKADISMRLLLAVRNKVIDAYREIMRMQF